MLDLSNTGSRDAIWKTPIDKWELSHYRIHMETEMRSNLRKVGEAFSAATGLAQSTIWARAAKDGRFLDRIESGKGFTAKTYDIVMAWFSENWPDGASWPFDVPRLSPNDIPLPEPECPFPETVRSQGCPES